jgi:hypothetical protein
LIDENGAAVAGGQVSLSENKRIVQLAFPGGLPAGSYSFVLRTGITGPSGIHLPSEFTAPVLIIGSKLWASDQGGNWADAANWNPAGAPTTNDFVVVNRTNANPLVHFARTSGFSPLVCRSLISSEDMDFPGSSGLLELEESAEFDRSLTIPTGAIGGFRGGQSILRGPLTNLSQVQLDQHLMELDVSPTPHFFDKSFVQLSVADPSAAKLASELRTLPGSILEFHSMDTNQNFPRLHISGSVGTTESLAPTFLNRGEFRKTGIGVGSIDTVLFQNTGLVDVREGLLEMGVGSTLTFRHDGQYQIAADATLQLQDANHLFGPLASIDGAGTILINGAAAFAGVYDFDGVTRITKDAEFNGLVRSAGQWVIRANATFSGLSAELKGAVTVAGGTLTCNSPAGTVFSNLVLGKEAINAVVFVSGGNLTGTGKVSIANSLVITNPLSISKSFHSPVTVDFDGPVEIASDFDMQSIRDATFNASAVWHSGLITSYSPGSPHIAPGATFEIATNGLWLRTDIINEGTFVKTSNGDTTLRAQATFGTVRNSGLLSVNAGRLVLESGFYSQTAGETRLAGGNLVFSQSANVTQFQFTGGQLTGSGILGGGLGLSGDAQISPGSGNGSPGILIITNTFGSAGINLFLGIAASDTNVQLNIDVGGPVAGTGFDQVVVYGNANVQGILNLHLVTGYVPNIGDTFQILKCAKLDDQQFAVVNGTAIAPGKAFKVNYVTAGQNPGIVLDVVSSP